MPQLERITEHRLYSAIDSGWLPLADRLRGVNHALKISDSAFVVPEINFRGQDGSLFASIDTFLSEANYDAPSNASENYQPIDMLRSLARSCEVADLLPKYKTLPREERISVVHRLFSQQDFERTLPARDYLLTYLSVGLAERGQLWEKGIRPAFQHEITLQRIIGRRHEMEGQPLNQILGRDRKINMTDSFGSVVLSPLGAEFDEYYGLMEDFHREAQFFVAAGVELPVWKAPEVSFAERVLSVDKNLQTAAFEYRSMQLEATKSPHEFAQAVLSDLTANADEQVSGQMIADLNALVEKRRIAGHATFDALPTRIRQQLESAVAVLVKVKADKLGISAGEFAFATLAIHEALVTGFDSKGKSLSQRQIGDLYSFTADILRGEGMQEKTARYAAIMGLNWSLYFTKGNVDLGKMRAFINDQSVKVQARVAVGSGMIAMTYLSRHRPNERDYESNNEYGKVMGDLKETIDAARKQSSPLAKAYRLQ